MFDAFTLKSLSSLLGDFFRDFWPGFLALDQNGDGTDGRDGRTEYSFTVLLGRRNTVYSTTGTEKYSVQYYWDRETTETFSPPREFPFYDHFSYQYRIEVSKKLSSLFF